MSGDELANVAPPVALTLAGSDCPSGAGLQADLKTFSSLGVYGLTVVTSVVAEVPGSVAATLPLPAGLVAQQYDLLLQSFPVAALKTGLLGSAEIIEELTPRLASFTGPVILDPVAVATSGHSLVAGDYGDALRNLIAKAATLVTPNRAEAEWLLGAPIHSADEARDAALRLAANLGCAVLLKGGHFDGAESTDWLADSSEVLAISRVRIPGGTSLHGTGCTYSAAITAELALGKGLHGAIEHARTYLHRACVHPYDWATSGCGNTKALAHERARVQI